MNSKVARAKDNHRKAAARSKPPAQKFTRAEQRRIRAHILARGMTFKVFLPESIANWLRKKIRAGVFHDPSEAAFVAFQDLVELDRHPQVRRQLLRAMLQGSIDDPRPSIPADKVLNRLRARERRYARTKPPRPQPLPKYRPGRGTKLGSLLTQLGREANGVDLDIKHDATPAAPASFE